MRSIEEFYKKIRINYPEPLSSYYCFFQATRGRGLCHEMITKWFNKLVEKEDYFMNEKKDIISYLLKVSNDPMEKAFWAKNRLRERLK